MSTAGAMAVLSYARLLVAFVSLKRWSSTLGLKHEQRRKTRSKPASAVANRCAVLVERAAFRLPFETKCLPRAMALSWLLRREQIAHTVVFAIRPSDSRDQPDSLHAWVEVGGKKLIGDLPGPWLETLRLAGER